MKIWAFTSIVLCAVVILVVGAQSSNASPQESAAPAVSVQKAGADQVRSAWGDFDGDGLMDVYVSVPEGPDRLMRNLGDGRFEEILQHAGLVDGRGSCSATWEDLDGDGDLDLHVLGQGGSRLYRNSGAGTFEDVTMVSGVWHVGQDRTAVWEDLDGDGLSDLRVLTAEGWRTYRNMGQLRFEESGGLSEVTEIAGRQVWGDYDGDAVADVYVINPTGADRLFRNARDGSFEDVTEQAQLVGVRGTTEARWIDFDADGDLDLQLVSNGGRCRLLRNPGNGAFDDLTASLRLDRLEHVSEVVWFDYDNDGFLDPRFVTSFGDHLFHNMGGTALEPVVLAGAAEAADHADEAARRTHGPSGNGGGRLVSGSEGPNGSETPSVRTDRSPVAKADGARRVTAGPHREILAAAPRSTRAPQRDSLGWGGSGGHLGHGTSGDVSIDGDLFVHPDSGIGIWCEGPIQALGSLVARAPANLPPIIIDNNNTNRVDDLNADLVDGLHASNIPALGQLHPLSENLNVSPAGNVGIGTTTPAAKLHVQGTTRLDGDLFVDQKLWANDQIVSLVPDGLAPFRIDNTTKMIPNLNADMIDDLHASDTPALGQLYPLSQDLNVSPEGNVGIGTTTPAAKLDVVGDVMMSGSIAVGGTVDGVDVSGHAANSSAHHIRYADDEAWDAVKARDGSGSGLDADLMDGFELSLSDGTPPNAGPSNLVNWDILTNVPPGFADGVDNVGEDADWQVTGNDLHAIPSGDVYVNRNLHVALDVYAGGDLEAGDDVEVDDDIYMINSGSKIYFQYYDDVWLEKEGTGSTIMIDGQAGGVGNLHVTGKITSDGGYDPPYVLYDAETRGAIIERVEREVPKEKRSGAVLFWNANASRFEVYLPGRGEFRDLLGNVLPWPRPGGVPSEGR